MTPSLSIKGECTVSFSIQIDTTQLFYRFFIIPGITPNWVDSRVVQTLNLEPGKYSFMVASAVFADFSFTITSDGKVSYENAFDSFLSGRGTSVLTIVGLEVTLDARYLSGAGVLLVCPLTNDDWIRNRTIRLVPASYQVQQGSAVACDFVFALKPDGTFSYDSSMDLAVGGFLNGNGTTKLEFYGYPILVDSRISIDAQASDPEPAWGVIVQPIWDMPFSKTGIQYTDLLPAKGFQIQNKSAILSTAIFDLSTNGTLSFDPSLPLKVDTFKGLNRLTVTGALVDQVKAP
jgi:hypothetical protein